MDNFENAKTATEEMFNGEQLSMEDAAVPEENTEETATETGQEVPPEVQPPAQENPEQANNELNDAVQTAEVAAQVANDTNAELLQARSENEQLRAQNEQLQQTISQMSEQRKEAIVEEAMEMPTLDVNALAFMDEDSIAKAQAEYAQKMAEFVRGDVMKEVSPFVEQAKEGIYQKEKNEVITALSQIPELSGIETMVPQLDKIIANNKWLQSDDMPTDEKFINAYAIARGVNAINTPPEEPKKELTPDEFAKLYDENPTYQEIIEKKRLEQIKQSQQVPPLSSSSGAVNAALNIKEKPKTFEEASERTRKMFGLE